MNRQKITEETLISPPEMALILGISARHLRRLVEDGVIEKAGNSVYNMIDTIQRYFGRKEQDKQDEDEKKIERTKRAADALLKKSKADIAKLEADELKGKMHREEDIETLVGDMIFAMRSALLALPGRLAVDVAGVQTPAEASAIIQKEVHQIMTELADYNYDPARYEERVRDRRAWDMERELDDD